MNTFRKCLGTYRFGLGRFQASKFLVDCSRIDLYRVRVRVRVVYFRIANTRTQHTSLSSFPFLFPEDHQYGINGVFTFVPKTKFLKPF